MRKLDRRGWRVLLPILAFLGACTTTPTPDIRTGGSPRVVTYGIDARDYNAMVTQFAQSILTDTSFPVTGDKVLALGPIDESACHYEFDPRLFQEKMQTILLRSRKFKVSFAADALGSESAARSRYDIMQLQWAKESAVDAEDLRTIGSLSKIDYLLFGRVATRTTSKGDYTEVTYTYNWKLGDCESGILVWADERERTKSGPRISSIFDPGLRKLPLLIAPMAFSKKSSEEYPALVAKWKEKGYGNAIWLTIEDMLYDAQRFEIVTMPEEDQDMFRALMGGRGVSGAQERSLVKFPSKILVANMNFFENKTESVSFARVKRSSEYHVQLFLRYFELDGKYLNVPISAKGEARHVDLLDATNLAAKNAIDRLLQRVERKWENEFDSQRRR